MSNILKEIAKTSRWKLPVFDGKIQFEGRILSVKESESAGLASGLIAANLASPEDIQKMQKLSELDEEDENDLEELIKITRTLKPEMLSKLNDSNEKIICQVVKKVSIDDGATWEKIQLVTAEEQQNPDKNILWVGVLSNEDREQILDKALSGHREGSERIKAAFPGS